MTMTGEEARFLREQLKALCSEVAALRARIDETLRVAEVCVAHIDRVPLCFSCGRWPQKYTTGLCEPCHVVAMSADYEHNP